MNIKFMIEELLKVNHKNWTIPEDNKEQKKMYDVLRTICVPAELSEEYYKNESEYIKFKTSTEEIINAEDISEELLENIYIYLGDITKIKTDAIVNAANEKLLGCFVPGHKCIDNAIHLAAGLKLRNACNDIMQKQGHDEPEGRAQITKGYNLPSKYVFHTVGPNIRKMRGIKDKAEKAEKIKEQLSACYISILDEANEHDDIKNVVFCSISTGVYGVPIEFASKIALETISDYLKNKENHVDRVVINVFSKGDYDEYKNQAEQIRAEYS